ncbi:unnamed protein product [Nezara viridula]|uniref:Uncharacterized protein n=1 Tax=Nezara viridula TaxID=85310 RepID=A0A9P0E650_NEZVI|nr:unnamed protein product [Nezara viridula]
MVPEPSPRGEGGKREWGGEADTQNYQFRYYVRDESTGDIKSQEETKQGGTVNGHYSVGEPTGDLRVVTYTADEGGFRADVKQDSAPAHKGKSNQQWLQKNIPEFISALDWPSGSSDLNPLGYGLWSEYEEGGSPASEDKARQTNSKSGVEFHWLPANPDDLQEGKIGTEDTSDVSEGNQSGIESTTNMSEQPSESNSEATTEHTSSTETNSESSTTEGSEMDIEIEKVSKESDSSSETFSTESSSETSNAISETPLSSSESTIASTESTENSMETSTMSAIEGKDTLQTDEESKTSTEDEQSAEAAESAPLSEEVLPPLQPSQMYLPVISYQNLPFLNLPMLDNTQGYSEKPPTIIYASQNFYNPWQWFGNSRRIARDVQQHVDQHIHTSTKGFQYPVIPRQYK